MQAAALSAFNVKLSSATRLVSASSSAVIIASSALGANERTVNVATGNTRSAIASSGSSRATNAVRVTRAAVPMKLSRSLT